MRQDLRKSAKIALTSVLSIALCASLGLGSVQAQGKKDKMSKDKTKMDTMHHDSMNHDAMMSDDNDEMGIPVAPSYPNSAPGNLDMNHWSDFRMKRMHHGSASEARMDKMKAKAKMVDEDEGRLLPEAPSYPMEAPGNLDMNHWTDFTQMHMKPGSAHEAHMDNMKKEMKKTK